MHSWSPGYTRSELDEAQDRYRLCFPPDLIALLLERQPEPGYDWRGDNPAIHRMLKWPFKTLSFDVEQGFWWPDWGERPGKASERAEVVRRALSDVPRLIPLIGHRFIPEEPNSVGNPVFSMHGFDTIYYGANLSEYLQNEFEGTHVVGTARHIPFWSDLVERFEDAYAFYAATGKPQALVANIQKSLRANDI